MQTTKFIAALATAALSTLITHAACAQQVSARIIVPYPPGGPADYLARLVAQKLRDTASQTVVVDNRPGGDAQIGTLAVVQSAPDGKTLLAQSVSLASVNIANTPTMRYDPARDLAPVVLLAKAPPVLIVGAQLPVSTLADLVALAKRSGKPLTYSTASSTGLRNIQLFKEKYGIDILAVPYKGSGPAVLAVAAGEVDLTSETLQVVKPLLDAGKVKALAVMSSQRISQLPSVPSAAESGAPEFRVMEGWWGLFAPSATPPQVVEALNHQVNDILARPDVGQLLREQGLVASASSVAVFTEFMNAEYARFLQYEGMKKP